MPYSTHIKDMNFSLSHQPMGQKKLDQQFRSYDIHQTLNLLHLEGRHPLPPVSWH